MNRFPRKAYLLQQPMAVAILFLASFLASHQRVHGALASKATIKPLWESGGLHFWYRNDLPEGSCEYVVFDLKKGVRQPAFDQNRLDSAFIRGKKDFRRVVFLGAPWGWWPVWRSPSKRLFPQTFARSGSTRPELAQMIARRRMSGTKVLK